MRDQKAINEKIRQAHLKRVAIGTAIYPRGGFYGSNHRIETKQRMSASHKRTNALKWNDTKVLIEKNCLIKKGVLRKYLVEIIGCCEICSLKEWNGKPLTLQMHHKDGDRHHNYRSNVQLLCPNCHSQTDNFGFKKRSGVV